MYTVMIFSAGSFFWPTWFSTDWIPPRVSSLWQYHHHWAASTEPLTHSGQCTFRCSLQHHSDSFEWCWAKQEQSINSAWWDFLDYTTAIIKNCLFCISVESNFMLCCAKRTRKNFSLWMSYFTNFTFLLSTVIPSLVCENSLQTPNSKLFFFC